MPGEGPSTGNSQKRLGEGAKGLSSEGHTKVSQESFAPSEACFAPMQPHVARVQEDFRPLGPKNFCTLSYYFRVWLLSAALWLANQNIIKLRFLR